MLSVPTAKKHKKQALQWLSMSNMPEFMKKKSKYSAFQKKLKKFLKKILTREK